MFMEQFLDWLLWNLYKTGQVYGPRISFIVLTVTRVFLSMT